MHNSALLNRMVGKNRNLSLWNWLLLLCGTAFQSDDRVTEAASSVPAAVIGDYRSPLCPESSGIVDLRVRSALPERKRGQDGLWKPRCSDS